MPLYTFIILTSWVVFFCYWFLSSFSAKRNAPQSGRGQLVRGFMFLLAAIIVWGMDTLHLRLSFGPYAEAFAWTGAILTALGIAFAVWARYYLGYNWGMPMSVKKEPELVTSGPYRFVRHPIYTGVLLAIFGSLITASPLWLVIFVVAAGYFTYSAKQEEALMAETFPDAYPTYKARTKMLIPFIF